MFWSKPWLQTPAFPSERNTYHELVRVKTSSSTGEKATHSAHSPLLKTNSKRCKVRMVAWSLGSVNVKSRSYFRNPNALCASHPLTKQYITRFQAESWVWPDALFLARGRETRTRSVRFKLRHREKQPTYSGERQPLNNNFATIFVFFYIWIHAVAQFAEGRILQLSVRKNS